MNWTPFITILAFAGVVVLFQNCNNAVPFGNTDYFQSLVNTPNFPYEVSVDQLAYMSCNEQDDIYNDGTFFTFRIGAFDSGGLRIAQGYRSHIEKVEDVDVPVALSMSRTSASTRLQFAIRTMDNLQLMYLDPDNGESGLDNSDYNNFFPVMGDQALNVMLWSLLPGQFMRNFAAAQFADQHRFEGELRFMKSQNMENSLRTFLGNRGVLAVTFAENGEILPIGPGNFQDLQDLADSGQSGNPGVPSGGNASVGTSSVRAASNYTPLSNDLSSNVYGVAIQPRFKQPLFRGGSPGSDMPPRVLSGVTDRIIDQRMTGLGQRNWVCPDSMHFMIVLPEDAIYDDGNGNQIVRCSMNPDPINPTEELKTIRQSLYAEDFYVDLVRRCIVPKPNHTVEGSCYGKNRNTQRTHIINYDSFNSTGCGFGNENGLCPHYASVCVRQ